MLKPKLNPIFQNGNIKPDIIKKHQDEIISTFNYNPDKYFNINFQHPKITNTLGQEEIITGRNILISKLLEDKIFMLIITLNYLDISKKNLLEENQKRDNKGGIGKSLENNQKLTQEILAKYNIQDNYFFDKNTIFQIKEIINVLKHTLENNNLKDFFAEEIKQDFQKLFDTGMFLDPEQTSGKGDFQDTITHSIRNATGLIVNIPDFFDLSDYIEKSLINYLIYKETIGKLLQVSEIINTNPQLKNEFYQNINLNGEFGTEIQASDLMIKINHECDKIIKK